MKRNKPIQKEFMILIVALILVFTLVSTLAFAIPNSLTLQGKLTNKASVSQQGTFTFMFRIYSVPDFGYYNITQNITLSNGSLAEANITYINYTSILWEQNQSVATDANGVYDVILKNVNLSFADQYYLGITIGSDNESTPRINLTSAPYSFRANVSEDLNANNSYFVTNLSITGNATIGTGGTTLAISTQTFNLTTIGNINLAGNITLGDKIGFTFGQVIDNLVNGFLRISGKLNVTGNVSIAQDTLFVDNTSNRVGIGTTSPQYLLQTASGTDGRSINLSNVLYVNGSSGRVGIGTSLPNQVLTVIGNVNITGNLTVGNGNTSLEISTPNFNVSSGNLFLSGSVKAGGGLNVSGDTNISGNFYVTGNTVIGDSTSDTVAVNAQISTNLIPQANNIDIGSATNFWRRAYIDLATINNLSAGGSDVGGTTSATFILNSNYSGNDARDIELIFERGTPVTNAVLFWDSTNKRFDINFPLFIQANQNLTVDTNTLFVDGSINKVGIGKLNPATELDVAGGINASTLNVSGNAYLATQSGSVGIGTTTPSSKLHINASDNFNTSVTNVLTLDHTNPNGVNLTGGIGVSILFRANDNASQLYNIGNISAILYNATNGSQKGAITFSTSGSDTGDGSFGHLIERVRIDGKGNVGINDTAPNQTLDVIGTLSVVSGSGTQGLFQDSSGKVGVGGTFANNQLVLTGTFTPETTGDSRILRIRSTINGNVGGDVQGIMLDPTLVEASSGTHTTMIGMQVSPIFTSGGADTTDAGGIQISAFTAPSGTTNAWGLKVAAPTSATNNYAALFTGGSVGIGTTSPLNTLHVNGSGAQGGFRVTNDSGTNVFFVNSSSGNVGIGTTSPQNALDVVGAVTVSRGLNASNLNVTGFSITDDSLVTLSDGTKKKIKDINAGEYVKTLDEKTGRIVAMKVNALRDHGVKLTYELTTKTGRAINTTGEHPYFVILKDKELCDKYLGNGFNNQYSKDDYLDEYGCFRWVEAKYLNNADEIIVPLKSDDNNYLAVFNTLLSPTSVNPTSLCDFSKYLATMPEPKSTLKAGCGLPNEMYNTSAPLSYSQDTCSGFSTINFSILLTSLSDQTSSKQSKQSHLRLMTLYKLQQDIYSLLQESCETSLSQEESQSRLSGQSQANLSSLKSQLLYQSSQDDLSQYAPSSRSSALSELQQPKTQSSFKDNILHTYINLFVSNSDIFFDKIASIKAVGEQHVYSTLR